MVIKSGFFNSVNGDRKYDKKVCRIFCVFDRKWSFSESE